MSEIRNRACIYEGKYTHLWLECKSKEQAELLLAEIDNASKLQKLIKERLKGAHKSGHKIFSDESGYLEQELKFLVEESEK